MSPDRTPEPDATERNDENGRRPGDAAFELPIVEPDDEGDDLDDFDDEPLDEESESMLLARTD